MDIKRKPVASHQPPEHGIPRSLTPNPPPPYSPYRSYSPSPVSPHSPHPPLPPRFTPSPTPSYIPYSPTLQPPHHLPRYRSQPNLRSSSFDPHPPPIPRAETSFPGDRSTTLPHADPLFRTDSSAPSQTADGDGTNNENNTKKSSSFVADARYFLGGLISHPSESNRHFSILRHSHGIVFYRGPTTSVTVSIFSSKPLPPDRKLWLQCKGWSGKTGMRAKALFKMHDDWVDASPGLALGVEQVDSHRERVWQRDIAKFYKKASKKVRENHRLRETVVARIPPDAEDGYFQLILCKKEKKVLCRSPVFRIISTSLDPSSLRGASLTTMPLEIGALVAGTYAQIAASKVLAPASAAANAASAKYTRGTVGPATIKTAYDAIKPDGTAPDMAVPPAIENGPQHPYPLDLTAKPTRALEGARISVKIPSEVQDKLRGYFFGWARPNIKSKPKSKSEPDHEHGQAWQMIILSVRLWDGTNTTGPVSLSQTTRKTTTLRFLHEHSQSENSPAPSLTIRLLGFLRPDIPPPSPRTEYDLATARQAAAEASLLADSYDTEYGQALLDHPLWGPETADPRKWTERTRTGAESVVARGQKMIERVGVRSGVEQDVGGGFYVVRDQGSQ